MHLHLVIYMYLCPWHYLGGLPRVCYELKNLLLAVSIQFLESLHTYSLSCSHTKITQSEKYGVRLYQRVFEFVTLSSSTNIGVCRRHQHMVSNNGETNGQPCICC